MTDVFAVQDEIAAAVVDGAEDQAARRGTEGKGDRPEGLHAVPAGPRDRPPGHDLRRSSNRSRCISRLSRSTPRIPPRGWTWPQLTALKSTAACGSPTRACNWRVRRRTKALALDPEYAPAHARLGWIAIYYDRDLAAAARHIEHALALEPANPDIIGTARHSGPAPRAPGSGDRNREVPDRPRSGERRRSLRIWALPTVTLGVSTRRSPSIARCSD